MDCGFLDTFDSTEYTVIIDGDARIEPRRDSVLTHPLMLVTPIRVRKCDPPDLCINSDYDEAWEFKSITLNFKMFAYFCHRAIEYVTPELLPRVSLDEELVITFRKLIIPSDKHRFCAIPLALASWLGYALDLDMFNIQPYYSNSYYMPIRP